MIIFIKYNFNYSGEDQKVNREDFQLWSLKNNRLALNESCIESIKTDKAYMLFNSFSEVLQLINIY